jgi:SAM-dependent methyltransferase
VSVRACPVDRRPWPVRAASTITRPLTRPASRYLSRQAARPRGAAGRLLARIWVTETAAVNDVATDLLAPRPGLSVLEIGFGPGRTLGRLAAAGAQVTGVEISPAMLAAAARRNADPVATGRMHLHLGDGTTLPAPDDSIDAVLAVHTLYFWPDPAATLTEAARVLRPGGRLVLAFRAGDHPLPRRFDRDVYHVPTTEHATRWMLAAGFTGIAVHTRPDLAPTVVWLTAATATDPARTPTA